MYRVPSARRRSKPESRINLVPILDAVFIMIFFLLFSAQFVKIFEIGSDLPILSDAPPPPPKLNDKPPLNLTIKVKSNQILVFTGQDAKLTRTFNKNNSGIYNVDEFHQYIVELKKQNPEEYTVVFEPDKKISYVELVKIMDEVRNFRPNELVGWETKDLFNQIVFGNSGS